MLGSQSGSFRRVIACIVGVACSLLVFSPSVLAEERYALLIGINSYGSNASEIPALRYAVNDVTALKGALESHGYNVIDLVDHNATRANILRKLYTLATDLEEDDMFLLYFAGHGLRNKRLNNETYWLTHLVYLEHMDVEGIRLSHLLDYVRDIPAEQKLVILDHCFSGDIVNDPTNIEPDPLRDGMGSPKIKIDTRGALLREEWRTTVEDSAKGMAILAAAREGALELESEEHGVMTAALLGALTSNKADEQGNNDGQLSLVEMIDFVDGEVTRLAQGAGFDQQMDDFSQGSNLSDWIIANALPVNNCQDAQVKKDEYSVKLSSWVSNGWIEIDVELKCRRALSSWINEVCNDDPMGETDRTVIDAARLRLDSSSSFQKELAESLGSAVGGL